MPVCGAFCSETETLHKAAHILTTKDKPADCTDDPFLVEKMCAELEGRCVVVQRGGGLCVSKPPGDRCDRNVGRNQDAGIRMAEAVEVN